MKLPVLVGPSFAILLGTSSAFALQPGEVVARYKVPANMGFTHGVGWDGEQLWLTSYSGTGVGRFDVEGASPESELRMTQKLELGWRKMEGCDHVGNHRLFVGPRKDGTRKSAAILEVDDRNGETIWEYSLKRFTWPDGRTRSNYKDPDGIAFDGTYVYYVVKGDHDNLGKAGVDVIRYSDKSIVKRFWLPDESPTDVDYTGGWLIYKPQWHGSYHNYPDNNFIRFVDVDSTQNGGMAVIPYAYNITNIPDSDLWGGSEKFVSWGVAHDGGKYLYVSRQNGCCKASPQAEILKIYAPLPGDQPSSGDNIPPE